MKQAFGRWWAETAVYLAHVAALARPGARVRGFAVHPFQAGALQGWQASDLCLLVEEGRRQVDRQRADLDRVQARSQLLFTVAGVLLGLLVSESDTTARHGTAVATIWYVGLVLVTLGLLGAAALMSVRSTFGGVDAALLSRQPAPVLRSMARAYAQAVAEGENTVATRLTVFRDAVLLVVVGAALQAGVWLATR
jgi:hypothetical protein